MITMNELVDLRMQQHLAHEIYRQQIMQRIPDPFPSMMPIPIPRQVLLPSRVTLPGVEATLQNNDLWKQFHQIGTEMIITKSGRRMFPSMRLSLAGIEDDSNYCVLLEMVPIGDCRYKYSGSHWVPAGGAEPQSPQRMYLHPDSPASGSHWKAQPILFNKVKLTNNTLDNNGHIVLASMHKYQPRIHIIHTSDPTQIPWAPQQAFVFPETEFIAVTAYQNDRITKLKIDNNPFAKGFRETGQSRCKRKINASSEQSSDRSLSKSSSDCDKLRSDDNDGPMAKRMRSNSSATSISSSDEGGISFSCSSSGASSPNVIIDQHNYLQSLASASTAVSASASPLVSSVSPSSIRNENLMQPVHQNMQNFINPAFVDLACSYFSRSPYASKFYSTAALHLQAANHNHHHHHHHHHTPHPQLPTTCFQPCKFPTTTENDTDLSPYTIPLLASTSATTSTSPSPSKDEQEPVVVVKKTKKSGFSISAILGAEN